MLGCVIRGPEAVSRTPSALTTEREYLKRSGFISKLVEICGNVPDETIVLEKALD